MRPGARIKTCLVTIGMLMSVWSGDALGREDLQRIFNRAGEHYRQGEYTEAVQSYRSILQEGYESGALYFNLGNAYFRLGDYGRAVLNYERSGRLIPRDSDLLFNRQYVRSQLGLPPRPRPSFARGGWFYQVAESYTLEEFVLAVCFLIFVSGILVLAAKFTARPRLWARGPRVAAAVCLLVVLILLGIKIQSGRRQAVSLDSVPARFEPREDATVHFDLTEGSLIRVVKKEGDWVMIRRPDGKRGWVNAESVEEI